MRAVHWILFALAVVEAAVLVLALRATHLAWPPLRLAGAGLLLLVLAWVAVARLQLGRSFAVTAQARQLITTGLYSRVRNPIYVATPFLFLGLAMLLLQLWPLLLLVIVLPIQVARAAREAAVLQAAFGADYERYRAKTWF